MADAQKLIDYGHRAVHLTAQAAKSLARAYYERPVRKSYWDSCSTGGREGLIEAQRYPDDFDGLIVGAPALDFSNMLVQHIWIQRAIERTPIPLAKLHLTGNAAYAKCDALDGIADGLIADPMACQFDPRRDVPACNAGDAHDACLTGAEAAALHLIYDGPVSRGRNFFPGATVGAEPALTGGPRSGWDIDASGNVKSGIDVAISQLRNAIFNDPGYDWRRFDLDTDLPKLDIFRREVDATDPKLSALRQRGGKVLMYYGWSDMILNPRMGIDYYNKAVTANGADTADFFRLFMVPGMFHCRGGYGPDRFDAMSAIVNWVERGEAPARLLASQVNSSGAVTRTRPLCPYPQIGRYLGRGPADEASSFVCAAAPANEGNKR